MRQQGSQVGREAVESMIGSFETVDKDEEECLLGHVFGDPRSECAQGASAFVTCFVVGPELKLEDPTFRCQG